MKTKIEKTMFWRGLPKVLQWVIILTASGTTLIVFVETAFRVFDFLNFNAYEEILIIVAFWMYMMGCAYGSYEKSQITADILEAMMKESLAKDIIRVIREVLTVALGVGFLYWGWGLIQYSFAIGSVTPVFRIPMTVGYASVFLGMILWLFYSTVYAIGVLKEIYFRRIKKLPPAGAAEENLVEGGM